MNQPVSCLPVSATKMSKAKKVLDEARDTQNREIDLVEKGISTFEELPGLREYSPSERILVRSELVFPNLEETTFSFLVFTTLVKLRFGFADCVWIFAQGEMWDCGGDTPYLWLWFRSLQLIYDQYSLSKRTNLSLNFSFQWIWLL